MLEAEVWYWERFRGGGPASRRTPRSTLPFSHAGVLGNVLGLEGPRETLVTACSSGAASLALAADLVADGVVTTAIAGGVDALTRICFMGFNALKLLGPEPCRPFDRDRRGMSIGEGAAFLVLGELEKARAPIPALVHEVVPPTANLATPDPDVAFDCVRRVAREAAVEYAISNSFGFGGQNVTLLFGRA